MIYFSDVDIVTKLARCGFLDDLPELLGVDPGQLSAAYLPSLPTRVKRNKGNIFSADAIASLTRFCDRFEAVESAADVERQQALIDGGMDAGEVILLVRAEATDGCVVTGDKRALRDYAKLSSAAERKKISVVCFEMLLLRVNDVFGFARLRDGCCGGLEADSMLKLAFSSGTLTTEDHALECIRSYLGEVESHSADIMHKF